MAGKKRRYKLLDVNRVDLVDRGANYDRATNDGSHIMLLKRAPDETQKQDLVCPSCDYRLSMGYGDRGATIPNYCPDCGAKLALRGSGSKTKQEQIMANETPNADVTKRLADLEALVAKQAAEQASAIEKAVAAAKAEAEAKSAAEKVELQTRLDASDAVLKAERETREIAETTSVVKASYPLVLMKAEDGGLLYRIRKGLAKEDAARIEEVFASAQEIARTSKLFAEVGKGGVPPADPNGNPEAAFMAKVAALREADPKLSEVDATVRARELYPVERMAYDRYKRDLVNPTAARQ